MTAAKQLNDRCNDQRNAEQFGRLDTQSWKDRKHTIQNTNNKKQQTTNINKTTQKETQNNYKDNTKQNKQ